MANSPWFTLSPELHLLIIERLSTIDLIRFRQASRAVKDIIDPYLTNNFKPEKFFERFLTAEETLQFRQLQYQTDLVVSGSSVLAFAARLNFVPSDLDCYVPLRHTPDTFRLLTGFGFTYIPPPTPNTSSTTHSTSPSPNPPVIESSPHDLSPAEQIRARELEYESAMTSYTKAVPNSHVIFYGLDGVVGVYTFER
ncbi:hypothetical protein MPER_03624, partial [Moniliophthora perniciosa FA553]